jgi:hypothetical protein
VPRPRRFQPPELPGMPRFGCDTPPQVGAAAAAGRSLALGRRRLRRRWPRRSHPDPPAQGRAGQSSRPTTRPTTCYYGRCAAVVTADSPCSPAAGALCGSSPSAPAESVTTESSARAHAHRATPAAHFSLRSPHCWLVGHLFGPRIPIVPDCDRSGYGPADVLGELRESPLSSIMLRRETPRPDKRGVRRSGQLSGFAAPIRQSCMRTTPGSTSSSPSKKDSTWARVRGM